MRKIIIFIMVVCPSVLFAQGLPKIDYEGVTGFQIPKVTFTEPTPPSTYHQLVNDPTNLILLAILGALAIIGYVLYQRKGS